MEQLPSSSQLLQPPQQYAACPKCGSTSAKKVRYTWWGGLLGPAVLTHVRCENCGTSYNGKTGKSNTTGIVIYSVAVLVVVCQILGLCAVLVNVLNNTSSYSGLTFTI